MSPTVTPATMNATPVGRIVRLVAKRPSALRHDHRR